MMVQKLIEVTKKNPLVFAGLFFTFFCCFTLFLFFFYPFTHTNLWKGYYTIIIRQKEGMVFNPDECRKALLARSLVTEETETVSFSCFNEMESILVTELDKRLDPLDPRIDPYMQKKITYFHLDNHSKVLYVASPLHPLVFFIKATLFFTPYVYTIRIQDIHLIEILIIFFAGWLFILIFLFVYNKESKVILAGLCGFFPWIPGLLSGDIMSVISLFLLYPAWFFLFEEVFVAFKHIVMFGWNGCKKENLIIRSIILLAVIIFTLFLSFLQGKTSFTILLSCFAQLSFIVCYCLFYYQGNRKKEHQLFECVPIRLFFKREYIFAKVKKIPFLLLIGVVIIFFSIYYFYRSPFITRKALYPVLETEKKNLTMGNLEVLWENKGTVFLPDLSDYIVHFAYQEGLLFGSTYTFPSYTEGLHVSYYEKEPFTGKIIKNKQSIKKYTHTWLKEMMSHIPLHSVENMLFHQGKAVSVALQPIGKYYQYRYPKIHIIIIFLFLLITIFFFDSYVTPSFMYDTKRFAIRRVPEAA